MKNILFVILITCVLIIFSGSGAYAFRCGDEIVGRWDSSASVLVKCGTPFQKDFVTEKINGRHQYVERWFYNCGDNNFIYALSVLNGIIVKEDSVNRGFGSSQCHGGNR